MCKILAMAGIKAPKEKLMWEFILKSRPFMTAADRDGVGYATLGPEGLWGERWRYPEEAFLKDSRRLYNNKDEEFRKKFKDGLDADLRYNAFGKGRAGDGNTAIIFHSRLATCDKTLENVHPFVRNNTALIHNGVINNADRLELITSTCDSEAILNEYVKADVANMPETIAEVTARLMGYYGCAVLTQNTEGKKYLDVFRERASIYMTYIEQLEAAVYCTSDSIIKDTCKELKWKHQHMFKLKEHQMFRIDAITGTLVDIFKFDPKAHWTGYTAENNSSAGGAADAGKFQLPAKLSEMKKGTGSNGQTGLVQSEEEKKSFPPLTSEAGSSSQENVEIVRSQNEKSAS